MNKIFFTFCFVFFFIVSSNCQLTPFSGINFATLEERCTNATGDPGYFEKAIDGITQTDECMDAALNRSALIDQIETLGPLGRLNEVFSETCGKQDAVIQCFQSESRNLLNVCLTEQEITTVQDHLKILKRAMNYACQNNGELITRFFTESGRECFTEKKLEVFHCVQPVFMKNGQTVSGKINCGDLTYLQKCIVPELRQCETQIAAKFINGLINNILDELSCNIRENDINYQNSIYLNEV